MDRSNDDRSAELELLYSPSRWSRRYEANEVVEKHTEFTHKVSDRNKTNIQCELNIPYGTAPREKIDIFGTDLPADSPIFIYVHGGYWCSLSREQSNYVVEPLHKQQIKSIIVGYTLCPEVTVKHIMTQVQRAFIKCLQYAKQHGSKKLYIAGHSAGAHLVVSIFKSFFASLSLDDQIILKKVFLISGIYDLTPLTKTYVNDAIQLDVHTAKEISPLYFNFQFENTFIKNIAFYMIVGENDSPAFKEQAKLFQNKLVELNCNTKFVLVNQVDHFDIVERLSDEHYEITRLIIHKETV